jgi:hypothetical protein
MSRRRIVLGLLLLSVVAVAVVGVALARDDEPNVDCATVRFDAAAWQQGDHSAQAEALDACGLLIGKTRAEVRAMLGAPDDRDADGIAYDVGPDSLGIDDMFLDVRFSDGKVSDTSIYQG